VLKKHDGKFEIMQKGLSETDRSALDAYLVNYKRHVLLSRQDNALLLTDTENAIVSLIEKGVPLTEALSRLDADNLGGFYARPAIVWYPLDDAAKIYPLSMKHGQMALFRLSVCLKEDVDPSLLQMALTFTIKRFPFFATTVKKGFFWHYLDSSKRRFNIEPEQCLPCQPMTISRSGSPSFRVLFYKNRISVEFFHILTDGTGGMAFLKTLVSEYLRISGVSCSYEGDMIDPNGTPTEDELSNQFPKTEHKGKASGFMGKAALQLGGRLSRTRPCRVIQFQMDAEQLKEAAKAHQATITSYMLSKLFLACRQASDETDGFFNIQIPVNMRKFYPSRTMRNFAMYCGIQISAEKIDDNADLIGEIKTQMEAKTSKEKMSEMVRSTEHIVSGVRYVPLFIKKPIAGIIYGFLGDKAFTTTLSNLGVITFPDALAGHIQSMDFVLGTAVVNRANCSLVTFGNTSTLSIEKLTADPSFEESLYALLEKDGITVHVEGSELYAN
jgi:hypothetical protein